jgi:hypothetical protein
LVSDRPEETLLPCADHCNIAIHHRQAGREASRGARRETLDAAAEMAYPLVDQFYGERCGRVHDPYGQQWIPRRLPELGTARLRRLLGCEHEQSDFDVGPDVLVGHERQHLAA